MTTGQHLIGGRYELGELLGRGGMAEVRKGTDTRLGRVVAIKRLRTDLASDATFQARFRREAQSSASLNHPAIVAVYDTGEERSTDGSDVAQPYIVMEYVAGRTLREILREGRKILPERALEITSGVLSALDYSHRAGIIHRDIKPGNVMLTPSGDVKVMDFGIARAISDASSTMTQTAAVVGTAQYLSPEQARGETVDSRSDVYSAGCLLYELLTGRPPFVGDSPVAVAYQHVREPALPPSDHDTDLPPEVDAIVMKSLAKRVEDRYQSAAAMRSDIERYLAGRPVHAVVPPPPPAALAPTPDPTATAIGAAVPEEEQRRSRTALYVLLAILVVALIAGAAYLLPKMFESPPDDVRVPDLIGKTEDEARALIGDAGLERRRPDVRGERRRPQGHGDPARTPTRTSSSHPGPRSTSWCPRASPQVEVPFVIGQQREEARTVLIDAGLRVKFEETRVRPAGRPGPRDEAGAGPAGRRELRGHGRLLRRAREDPERGRHDAAAGREGAPRGRLRAGRRPLRRDHRAEGHGHPAEPARGRGGPGGRDGHDRGLDVPGADGAAAHRRTPRPTPRRCRRRRPTSPVAAAAAARPAWR